MTADAVRGHLLCTHPIHGSHSSYINTQTTVNIQMCSHKILGYEENKLHYCKRNEVQPESSQTRT